MLHSYLQNRGRSFPFDLKSAEKDVVIEGIPIRVQRRVATFPSLLGLNKLRKPIHAMISGMCDEQSLWSSSQRWQIVDQIVAVRNHDGTYPMITVKVSSVARPRRPDGATEAVEARASEAPDMALLITGQAPQIVEGVPSSGSGMFSRGSLADGRLHKGIWIDSIGQFRAHRWRRRIEICRLVPLALSFALWLCTRKCVSKRALCLHPFSIFQHPNGDLPITVKTNAISTVIRSPILAPCGSAALPGHPQSTRLIIGQ